jgi:Flp pilus assembly protein TadG
VSRRHDERGVALVETPIAVVVILLLGLGMLTLAQVAWTHLDLASSVRGAARFSARAEWEPGSTSLARRRSPEEVVAEWRQQVADEIGVDVDDVTISLDGDPRDLGPGDEVVVTVEARVTNALYRLAAGATNGLASFVGADGPFDTEGLRVSAEALARIE